MATLRATLPDLFLSRLANLDDVIFENYKIRMGVSQKIFRVLETDKPFVRVTTVGSFGTVPIKAEGASVTYDDLAQGFDTVYQADTYELAFRTSKEALDDEQEEIVSDAGRALGNSMTYTYEVDHANLFNNGFTSTTGSPDGVALFSTAHPRVGGGNAQNTLTTAADLSIGSLRDALNDIADQTDDAGKLITWKPKYLVVPTELGWLAQEMIKSGTNSEGANPGVVNAFSANDDGLEVVVWNGYLTDNDAWFLVAAPAEHNVRTYWRERPNVLHDWDFETSSMKVKQRARWKRGWSHYAGIYGSPGA